MTSSHLTYFNEAPKICNVSIFLNAKFATVSLSFSTEKSSFLSVYRAYYERYFFITYTFKVKTAWLERKFPENVTNLV